ncbi:MAG: hypothetical protein LWX70_12380, partial [Sphingobacteriia bacterium]|nr:hypothetical protein [Sphingobacteriia bacterium]
DQAVESIVFIQAGGRNHRESIMYQYSPFLSCTKNRHLKIQSFGLQLRPVSPIEHHLTHRLTRL